MISLIRLFFVSTLLIAPSLANAEEPSVESLNFVELFSKDNFKQLAYRTSKNSETYKIISHAAPVKGKKIFQKNLDAEIEQNYEVWKRNNALAWSEVLTEEEMKSLTSNPKSSPYLKKMIKLQSVAGEKMKEKSQDVLIQTVSNALEKTFKEVVK